MQIYLHFSKAYETVLLYRSRAEMKNIRSYSTKKEILSDIFLQIER